MKVEILDYKREERGIKIGVIDIKVDHGGGKWEIFRGLGHFKKESRLWVNIQNAKRDDKWLPTYEREPNLKGIMVEALKELDKWLELNETNSMLGFDRE